ncbi:TetR/AcrR family transcriptional regulator [Nocardioides kongjuensis]|uniref:AcrR family transcriptional regulator n=1 Tax=Nocardioides kongjuensis TaxID=349522 RepID=A0A852S3A0_9ACTN|nr:TetR family transcriptional regulator C-terminal domain-containing protein [Nocardioides kongjuensis]NYD33252.1 AcrR family transcriptional regulator [Nocardioides kongjuensis]
MPTSTPRRTNAVTDEAIAERRAEILRHTADVIVATGVAGCTFAAVSEASGHSIGQLQHHFRTRDRLIAGCIEHRMTESQDEWRAIAERDAAPLVRLRALLDYTVAGEKDFADAWGFWIEVTAAARLDADVRAKVNERLALWHELFTDVLTDAMADAESHYSPADLAGLLVGLADGLAVQSVNGTYGMDPQRMHALLMDFAATALGVDLDGGTR